MSLVNGLNAIGFIYDGGLWKLAVCAKNISINESTAYIKTSVSGSGKDETVAMTENSATATIDGLVSLNESGKISLPELKLKQRSQVKFLFRYQLTARDGTLYTEESYFFITSSTVSGSYDGVATYSVEMRRTGSATIITTPTASVITTKDMRYPYSGIGGETGFIDATLIGKYILGVWKDGIGNSAIITSGTPINKEVKYTTGTGQFEWAVPFEAGEQAFIIYRDI